MKLKPINMLVEDSIKEVFERILMVAMTYKVLVLGYSGGKDSSVLLDLTLKALLYMRSKGYELPMLIVQNNNTQVENPEIPEYLSKEYQKIELFAIEHGLNVTINIATPSLTDHWAVSIMTGRKMPTYPDKSTADCSVDYKIKPSAKSIKDLILNKGFSFDQCLYLLGTRLGEGTVRKGNMEARGESHLTIAKNSDTGDSFAPIADWSDDDIWGYIQLVMTEERCLSDGSPLTGFSNLHETWRIYQDANESDGCHVFGNAPSKKGCGARHGCWSCAKVEDNASLRAMIQNDERYAYMAPLHAIQQFIVKSQFDWEMRNPLKRTISAQGFLPIQPDTLHPKTIEKLFLACLTVDRDSDAEAWELGLAKPRIEPILTTERIAYIDAIWSLKGFFEPFHAWKLVEEIYSYRRSFYFDETEKTPKTALPPLRWLDLREHYKLDDTDVESSLWRNLKTLREGCMFLECETLDDLPSYSDGHSFLNGKPLDAESVIKEKLNKSISINTDNLSEFLEEAAGFRLRGNTLSLIERVKNHEVKKSSLGRVQGFKSYLDFGILKYTKSQKGWITNTVRLTLARVNAVGSWDIPTYSSLLNKTVAKIPSELPYLYDERIRETLEEPLLYDFSELDMENNIFATVKKVRPKLSVSATTDLHNQLTLL